MRPFGYHIQGGGNVGVSLNETARLHHFTAAQIFLGPPQRFSHPPIPPLQGAQFVEVKSATGIKVYVHAPYVLHTFAKKENVARNNTAVAYAMETAADLGCDGYVLHTGGTKWYTDEEYDEVFRDLAESCKAQLPRIPLLIENCASGNSMSGDLQVICSKLQILRDSGYNVGLCLDTCHAYSFGYDISEQMTLDFLAGVIKPYLQLIHLNSAPSTVVCGGHLDRHASLLEGVIPHDAFRQLLAYFPDTPCIVERDSYTGVLGDRAFVEAADEANAKVLASRFSDAAVH